MNKLSGFKMQIILSRLDATVEMINKALQKPPAADIWLGGSILVIGEVKRDLLEAALTDIEVEAVEKEKAA